MGLEGLAALGRAVKTIEKLGDLANQNGPKANTVDERTLLGITLPTQLQNSLNKRDLSNSTQNDLDQEAKKNNVNRTTILPDGRELNIRVSHGKKDKVFHTLTVVDPADPKNTVRNGEFQFKGTDIEKSTIPSAEIKKILHQLNPAGGTPPVLYGEEKFSQVKEILTFNASEKVKTLMAGGKLLSSDKNSDAHGIKHREYSLDGKGVLLDQNAAGSIMLRHGAEVGKFSFENGKLVSLDPEQNLSIERAVKILSQLKPEEGKGNVYAKAEPFTTMTLPEFKVAIKNLPDGVIKEDIKEALLLTPKKPAIDDFDTRKDPEKTTEEFIKILYAPPPAPASAVSRAKITPPASKKR